jgi:hypothetical protein
MVENLKKNKNIKWQIKKQKKNLKANIKFANNFIENGRKERRQ